MNIFYLSKDPKTAAVWHNDKHVVKMILESAQLLSTAHRILDGENCIPEIYKATHKNHPSAVWARANINNYMWLYGLFCSLCDEYTFRYGKTHLTDTKLRNVLNQAPMNISKDAFFQPPQAMPDSYRSADSIISYRNYYKFEKNHLASWSKRPTPEWYSVEK
jgi:hypothetical protein